MQRTHVDNQTQNHQTSRDQSLAQTTAESTDSSEYTAHSESAHETEDVECEEGSGFAPEVGHEVHCQVDDRGGDKFNGEVDDNTGDTLGRGAV